MKRANILFLLSDEHSFRCFSHLKSSPLGEPVETPNLDALRAKSASFSDAYCQMPLCTPSRLCLFTGREAARAGAWKNGSILDPELPTLPEVLAEAGYETCLVGKLHFGGRNQMAGFQHRPYGDLTGGTGHQRQEKPDWFDGSRFAWRVSGVGELGFPESLLQENIVSQESVSWIREHEQAGKGKPWFLCASFSRPHFPLTAPRRWFRRYWPAGVTPPKAPPAGDSYDHPMCVNMRRGFEVDGLTEEETLKMRAGYFACVSFLDEIIGDFLARLERDGLLDNTIVVYASDHGEMAGEHGSWWKHSFHEASARVPLMISLPEHRDGRLKPQELQTPVALIDLFPTLCSLGGTDGPEDIDGMDLSAAIEGKEQLGSRPIFCDNFHPRWGAGSEFRMIRYEQFKYVGFRDGSEFLFDLSDDPLEQRDLIRRPRGERDEQMAARLRSMVKRSVDFAEVEADRLSWSRRLEREYALRGLADHGNHFRMPDGSVAYADGLVYRPDTIASSMEEICGERDAAAVAERGGTR